MAVNMRMLNVGAGKILIKGDKICITILSVIMMIENQQYDYQITISHNRL